ncbi:hypothetical protein KIPB_003826 [Kipferlia bialata]|uniref:Uncharacterized protein n=2 Tax=Kipferlia bialata TaxID=797122 RepID=A0A9K3CW27_9EUKA|nr:hypothetical protein KIPB_003826 [Kipferlia bialata]|eukprot:g3826.t1
MTDTNTVPVVESKTEATTSLSEPVRRAAPQESGSPAESEPVKRVRTEDDAVPPVKKSHKKHRYVLYVAFAGVNYHGSQIQPHHPTAVMRLLLIKRTVLLHTFTVFANVIQLLAIFVIARLKTTIADLRDGVTSSPKASKPKGE